MSWVGKQLCSSRSSAQGRSGTPCSQHRLPWVTAAASGATHRLLSLSQGAVMGNLPPDTSPGWSRLPRPSPEPPARAG